MSNETCHIVTLDVDLAAPVNQNVKAKLEEAEAANVMQVSEQDARDTIRDCDTIYSTTQDGDQRYA